MAVDLTTLIPAITEVHGGTAVLQPDGRTVRFTPVTDLNDNNTPGGFGFKYKANDGTFTYTTSDLVSHTVAMSG